MGYFSAQRTRHSLLISVFLLLAVLPFTAGRANAGTVITKCNDCHGMPPKDAARLGNPTFQADVSATVGSHQKHLATTPVANDCVVCHGAVISATDHQNDVINMAAPISGGSYGKGVFFNQTSIPLLNSTATCSSVSCHADPYSAGSVITPIWGTAALNCSACHTTPIGVTGPATGGHAAHPVVCTNCHNSGTSATSMPTTGHIDTNITVVNVGYPATVAKHAAGSGYTTCSAASCHSNVYGSGTLTTPVWGASAGCSACHSVAIGLTGPATGSHVVHNDSTCTDCHNAGTTSITKPTTGHADGDIDVTNGYPPNVAKHAAGSYTGTCSTATCHANVYGTGNVTTPVWGVITASCAACHTTPIATTGPATGSHAIHNNTDCSQCHTGATTSAALPTLNHIDGDIDVNSGYPANVAKHTTASGFGGRTCSTATCHANVYGTGTAVTPVWGVSSGCSACHTAIPIGATGPATGSHVVHNDSTCTHCHTAGTTATTVPGTLHANGSINVTNGYPVTAKHVAGSYTGTCSTSVCHGQGAPTWGATYVAPGNTFPYSSSTCGKCHSESGTVTAGTPFYSTAIPKMTLNTDAKAGAHTAHLTSSENLHPSLVCADCHGTVNLGDATHMNGSTTFNFGALAKTGGLTPAYDSATGQCSSVYCHGGAMPGGDTSGSNRTPTWNNPNYLPASLSVAGCGTCHGFPPPVSAGHPAVTLPVGFPSASVPIGPTCNCHSNVSPTGYSYATIFVDNTKHINGTLEGGSCNTCHGYPPVSAGFAGAGTVGNWENAGPENYLGGGGAHTINGHVSKLAKHNDGFAYCNKCHSSADHATSPEIFLPSTNIKVNVNQRYRFEAAKQFKYTSNRLDADAHVTGNCTNSSCHFGASPKWDPAH